jgi:hypothetical protein
MKTLIIRGTHNMASRPETARQVSLALAFAPVHKMALGVAVGTVFGLVIFAVTVFHVVLRPVGALDIRLLAQYFYGYDVSWPGAFVGLFWGFATGFVMGWFVAFVRNFVIATRIFTLKAKADLVRTADFLDHI